MLFLSSTDSVASQLLWCYSQCMFTGYRVVHCFCFFLIILPGNMWLLETNEVKNRDKNVKTQKLRCRPYIWPTWIQCVPCTTWLPKLSLWPWKSQEHPILEHFTELLTRWAKYCLGNPLITLALLGKKRQGNKERNKNIQVLTPSYSPNKHSIEAISLLPECNRGDDWGEIIIRNNLPGVFSIEMGVFTLYRFHL